MLYCTRTIIQILSFIFLFVVPIFVLGLFMYVTGFKNNFGFNFNDFLLPVGVALVCASILIKLTPGARMLRASVGLNALALVAILCASQFNIMISREVWVERGMPTRYQTVATGEQNTAPARLSFLEEPY